MDCWGAVCGLRWPGVGRIRGGHARVGRIISLPTRDIWPAENGPADFVLVYLADFVQRATFNCYWLHRAGGLRRILLAWTRYGVRGAQSGLAYSLGRATANK